MVVLARLGIDPNPDYPKNSPPRPSPIPSPEPSPTDIIASVTSSVTASISAASPTSTSDGNSFLHIAENGTSGDKILRGFLIGMAIGIAMSFILCCWMPCFRKKRRTRLERRNDNIRRRLVVLEDEAWVNQNWPQRRPWDIGEDESHSHDSHSHVSHEEA